MLPSESVLPDPEHLLSEKDSETLKECDLTNKDSMSGAIKIGEKIASNKQNNRLFSEFKRDISSWRRNFNKLKLEDFKDKSKNWESAVETIKYDTWNYKKIAVKDLKDKTIIINHYAASYSEEMKHLNNIIETVKLLNEKQLQYLQDNYSKCFWSQKEIDDARNLIKALSANPDEMSGISIIHENDEKLIKERKKKTEPSSKKIRELNLGINITLKQFLDLQEKLLKLQPKAKDYLLSFLQCNKKKSDLLKKLERRYKECENKVKKYTYTKKLGLNNSKAQYMDAMNEAANNALEEAKKEKQ